VRGIVGHLVPDGDLKTGHAVPTRLGRRQVMSAADITLSDGGRSRRTRALPPFGAAREREFAAVAAAHKQVLCIAGVLPGIPGISPDLAGRNRDAKRARRR